VVQLKIQNGDLTFIEKDSDNLLETILAVKSYVPKHSFVRRGLYFIMKETKGDYNRMGLAIIKASIEKSEANIKFSSDETNFRNELISIYQKNLSEIKIK
jgi:hypothetical protein